VGNVTNYLHTFAVFLINLLIVAIAARAIASWFVRDWGNPLMRFLLDVTEPILAPLRRLLPFAMGMDFSPMIAILGLFFVRGLLGA